ncbi:hypothetical protein KKF32_03415 [Patescibacteria group bacterium]|nr:hypothetical protein [Patescibacteria group bacterium]
MPRKKTKKTIAKKTVKKKRAVKQPKEVKLPVRIKQTSRSRVTRDSGQALRQSSGQAVEKETKEVKQVEQLIKETKKSYQAEHKTKKINGKKEKVLVRKPASYQKEKSKRMIMWTGVAAVMIIIFIAWTFSLKDMFKAKQQPSEFNPAIEEWDRIADEFSQTLEKVKEGMSQLKDEMTDDSESLEQATERDIFSEPATTTESEILSEEEKINDVEELKRRLEELENKIESGDQATSTPND